MKDAKAVFFGPAMLVTAAFIGPGTVLTASQAGAKYGFSLLWAVVFATLTGIVLQEMAGRLGIATGSGLAQAIRRAISVTWLRRSILSVALIGIFIGNCAFQTGNLLGSAAGIEVVQGQLASPFPAQGNLVGQVPAADLTPSEPVRASIQVGPIAIVFLAIIAGGLILIGKFEWIQRILTGLVVLMSSAFLVAAGMASPNLGPMLQGLIPTIPPGSGWLIIGLIGTTVVPYNLFLHASATAHRWPRDRVSKTSNRIQAVRESAKNTMFSVSLGGLITASILITAAVAYAPESSDSPRMTTARDLTSVAEIALQLEPALGAWAQSLFGLGLFAAGLTSAITAPVAAAYAVAGSVGWPSQLSDWRLKLVAAIVLLTGLLFALLFGNSPQDAILMAQVANGFLLPILAILLLMMINRVDLVTRFQNRSLQNFMAITAILFVTLIAARQLWMVYPKIRSRLFQPAVVSISCDAASPLATEV